MNNLTQINSYEDLTDTQARKIVGGGITVNIGVDWSGLRDAIWGFCDGISGQKHKSKKQRGR